MSLSPSPPQAAASDAVHLKFQTAIAKFLVTQSDHLRGLENALRDESNAMLQELQDQVCSQMSNISQPTGLQALIDELFARPEVQYGLIGWLGEKGDSKRAKMLVEELHVDIRTGEGNEARTTLNKLLPLYMKALNVREICGNKVPAASPGGKNNDKKLLGYLIQGCMRPFLDQVRTMYSDAVDNGDTYAADKSEDFRESSKRLKSALFVFLSTGNFASHNRGKLSFCQKIELCGAVGAMAETFPLIVQACQVVKATRGFKSSGNVRPVKTAAIADVNADTEKSRNDNNNAEDKLQLKPVTVSLPLPDENSKLLLEITTKEGGETFTESSVLQRTLSHDIETTNSSLSVPCEAQVFTSTMENSSVKAQQQINFGEYYKKCLIDDSSVKPGQYEKYEATLAHMDMTSKARLCVKGTSCRSVDCAESHDIVEALVFNPLAVTLKCPVPESCRHDVVHENKLCLFNHGEFKGAGTFRWGKKKLCWDLAGCTNVDCFRSHSLAEICWFNPSFRTEDCPEGINCQWKQNCTAFHEEYNHTKRSAYQNEYIGVAEPILFLERTLKVLQKVSVSSQEKSAEECTPLKTLMKTLPCIIKYHERQMKALRISSSERAKYTRVLSHMQVVPKARMCMKGKQCNEGGGVRRCCESHNIMEALSFNPLVMTLTCPTPKNSRDDFIHINGLCLFHHGDIAVPKSFRDTKQLLCADLDKCVDGSCLKSHSVVEVCWFFPRFRIKKCHQGDSCKQIQNCSLFHPEYHQKRDLLVNSVVGKLERVLFISRTLLELTRLQGTNQKLNRENRNDFSITSCDSSDASEKLSQTPHDDTGFIAVDSDTFDLRPKQDGDCLMQQYEIALTKCPDDELPKYEQILAHMKLVPKARLCSKTERHDNAAQMETCGEAHTRMEALGCNPLAMVLKCPITVYLEGSNHRQSLCVFDHDDAVVPMEFLKEKNHLCEAFDTCDNTDCVKSHSFAEVCWFNPQFRVIDCPQGSMCPHKQICVGFRSEHSTRRDARMNIQIGATEATMFVERVYAALTKQRTHDSSHIHPILAAESTNASRNAVQEQETPGTARASQKPETSKVDQGEGGEPGCKMS